MFTYNKTIIKYSSKWFLFLYVKINEILLDNK